VAAEVGTAGRRTDVAIRQAIATEYDAIGELTVRAYETVGDPLLGVPTYLAYVLTF
jgi:hypothetical protein